MAKTYKATFKVQAPLTPPKTTTGSTSTRSTTTAPAITTPRHARRRRRRPRRRRPRRPPTTGGGGGGGGGGGSTNHPPTDITLVGIVRPREPARRHDRRDARGRRSGRRRHGDLLARHDALCAGTDNALVHDQRQRRSKTAASFDFETKASYSICVRATDNGGPHLRQAAHRDGHERRTRRRPTSRSRASSVAENQPAGTAVGTLSDDRSRTRATRRPSRSSRAAAAPAPTTRSFTISGSQLKTAASFDFETKSSYSICVRVTDSGGLTLRQAVHGHRSRTSTRRRPDIALSNASVPRTSRRTRSSARSQLDRRGPAGTDLHLHARRRHRLGRQLVVHDHRQPAADRRRASTSRRSRATRSASARPTAARRRSSFEKVFTIAVTERQRVADQHDALAGERRREPAGRHGRRHALGDRSRTPATRRPSRSSRAPAARAPTTRSFTITGNQLKTAASFDFETKSSYSICVRATDSGSLTFDKPLTVTVTDVNDPPVAVDDTLSAVAEDSGQRTIPAATLLANDSPGPAERVARRR